MKELNFKALITRSREIRNAYHQLEKQYHNSEWSVEEDALAFLTDAGLIGRNVMSQGQRWPKANTKEELQHKLGECIWWLTVLADRSGLDIEQATEQFLTEKESQLNKT